MCTSLPRVTINSLVKNMKKNKDSSKKHIMQSCLEHDVKFIRLWFTDILGNLKSVAITVEELEHALADGISFDGSSISGFARSEEYDMLAIPDPQTFKILPWRPKEQAVARMFCNIQTTEGKDFTSDPRNILISILSKLRKNGFTFYVSPEIEFFYFHSKNNPEPIDEGGYFDLTTLDATSDIRRETVLMLEDLGIGVAVSHHEGAPSQHEMDLRHTDALSMADSIMTFKTVVKEVAYKHDVYASFMPKPLTNFNGSGMHLQISLFKGQENIFFSNSDKRNLSTIAKQFIAGLITHTPEIMLITNQWINSYKRLVPGFEAPTNATWSLTNYSDLIRVPRFNKKQKDSARIEYRVADPACNPYLALAAVLAAGLEGIENKYKLKDINDKNAEQLPESLGDSIKLFEQSTLMKKLLGKESFNALLKNKKEEWSEYKQQVSDYELDKYLSTL